MLKCRKHGERKKNDDFMVKSENKINQKFFLKVSDKKLNNDDKVLTANTVNSFQRAWATPERANNVPHFLLHHDYLNLLRGACAQH